MVENCIAVHFLANAMYGNLYRSGIVVLLFWLVNGCRVLCLYQFSYPAFQKICFTSRTGSKTGYNLTNDPAIPHLTIDVINLRISLSFSITLCRCALRHYEQHWLLFKYHLQLYFLYIHIYIHVCI